jgi:hypothetical protein
MTADERSRPVFGGDPERANKLKEWQALAEGIISSKAEIPPIAEGEVEFEVSDWNPL